MLLKNLRALIKRGESNTLEFKKSTGQLHVAMKTVCAFLNQDGGTVLFGVTDAGALVGQSVADKTDRDIANELEKIEPHVVAKIEYITLDTGKQVVAVTVREGKNKPYSYDGRSYARIQSTTQTMSRDEYVQLIQENGRLLPGWDNQFTNDCTLNDLDKKHIREVVQAGIAARRISDVAAKASIVEILIKLKLIKDERLTNAAVVLFCKHEEKQFIQAEIKLARFLGLDKKEFLDSKMYRDNVFELLEKAMVFLTLHLPIAARIEEGKLQRTETPAIPFKVLREALINALCHRNYAMRSGSISVAIYDDRVEIVNAGSLPPDLQLSALRKPHASYPHNRLIADILYKCCMIEQWGRGTLDMIELCKQAGIPTPRFEESSGTFSVVLPLKEPLRQFARAQTNLQALYKKLIAREKEIIEILKHGSMSREQIMDNLQQSVSPRTMQSDLAKLKALEVVKSEGKGKLIIWALTAY